MSIFVLLILPLFKIVFSRVVIIPPCWVMLSTPRFTDRATFSGTLIISIGLAEFCQTFYPGVFSNSTWFTPSLYLFLFCLFPFEIRRCHKEHF